MSDCSRAVTIFALLFMTSPAAFAVDPLPAPIKQNPLICELTGQIDYSPTGTELTASVAKQMALTAARRNLKGFCEWNRMDRATGTILGGDASLVAEYRKLKAIGDRDAAAKFLASDPRLNLGSAGGTAWEASLFGHPLLKRAVYQSAFYWGDGGCSLEGKWCAENVVKEFSRTDLKWLDEPVELDLSVSNNHSQSTGEAGSHLSELFGACMRIDPFNARGCVAAAKDLLEVLAINVSEDGGRVIGKSILQQVLSERRITSALQTTTVKLWSRIAKGDFPKNANIFTDLKSQLIQSGFDPISAGNWTIKILGAISTGGPNFESRLPNKKGYDVGFFENGCTELTNGCNINAMAMAAIAEGLANADTVKMETYADATPYSLPAGAEFSCDSGKWYHFWMPAALVVNLIEKKHSPTAARAAVFISHLGYHLRPPYNARKSDLLNLVRFGSIENGIRMDIALASAGSYFGAHSETMTSDAALNIHEAFIKMIDAGAINPTPPTQDNTSPKKLSEMVDILKWFDNVAPKTAYDFYK